MKAVEKSLPSYANQKDRWIIIERVGDEGEMIFYNLHIGRNCNKILPYEDAKKITQKLGIKSVKEYQELYRDGKLPQGMPQNPALVYTKNSKWTRVSRGKSEWMFANNPEEFKFMLEDIKCLN